MKSDAPPDQRALADDLRQQAPDNPRVAAKLHSTRARLHLSEQDANAGAYAHTRATRLHDEIDSVPALTPWAADTPPLPGLRPSAVAARAVPATRQPERIP